MAQGWGCHRFDFRGGTVWFLRVVSLNWGLFRAERQFDLLFKNNLSSFHQSITLMPQLMVLLWCSWMSHIVEIKKNCCLSLTVRLDETKTTRASYCWPEVGQPRDPMCGLPKLKKFSFIMWAFKTLHLLHFQAPKFRTHCDPTNWKSLPTPGLILQWNL